MYVNVKSTEIGDWWFQFTLDSFADFRWSVLLDHLTIARWPCQTWFVYYHPNKVWRTWPLDWDQRQMYRVDRWFSYRRKVLCKSISITEDCDQVVQLYINTCIHACMHAYIHAYIHTYINTYAHIWVLTLSTNSSTILPSFIVHPWH